MHVAFTCVSARGVLQVCPSTGLPCACSGATGLANGGSAGMGGGDGASSGAGCLANGGEVKSGAGGRIDADAGEVVSSSADKLAVGGGAGYTRPTAEPIFPAALRGRAPRALCLPGPHATWHRCGRLLCKS